MRSIWFGVALMAVSALSFADEARPDAGGENEEAGAAPATETEPFPEPEPDPESTLVKEATSCRPADQLDAAVTRLLGSADANHDDAVSKAEANALAGHLVNGFFFRADANRNGTITPQEARQARIHFMIRHPVLATLARQTRSVKSTSSFARVARLLDIEYGKPVPVSEARNAVRAAVDDVFRLADRDKDGSLDADEASTSSLAGTFALGRSVFRGSDADRDKGLSVDEFRSSIDTPLRMAFQLADADNNGKLDEPEASVAIEELSKRLVLPTAAPPDAEQAQK